MQNYLFINLQNITDVVPKMEIMFCFLCSSVLSNTAYRTCRYLRYLPFSVNAYCRFVDLFSEQFTWNSYIWTITDCFPDRLLSHARPTPPAPWPLTWPRRRRWSGQRRRSCGATATWTSSSITPASVTVATSWTLTSLSSGPSWTPTTLDPSR